MRRRRLIPASRAKDAAPEESHRHTAQIIITCNVYLSSSQYGFENLIVHKAELSKADRHITYTLTLLGRSSTGVVSLKFSPGARVPGYPLRGT